MTALAALTHVRINKIKHLALMLSVLPKKTSSSVRKYLKEVLWSTLFTHNHLLKRLSSTANPITSTTFTDIQFTLLLAKNVYNRQVIFEG